MSIAISKSPDSRYWRQLHRAALFEIEECELPARMQKPRRRSCYGRENCLLTVELEGTGNGRRKSDPDFAVRHASVRSLYAVLSELFGCKLAALHVACI